MQIPCLHCESLWVWGQESAFEQTVVDVGVGWGVGPNLQGTRQLPSPVSVF